MAGGGSAEGWGADEDSLAADEGEGDDDSELGEAGGLYGPPVAATPAQVRVAQAMASGKSEYGMRARPARGVGYVSAA